MRRPRRGRLSDRCALLAGQQHLIGDSWAEGQGRLGLAILVPGKGIHASAEQLGSLPLLEFQFLPHIGDVGGTDLPLELPDQITKAVAMLPVQDDLIASGAKLAFKLPYGRLPRGAPSG